MSILASAVTPLECLNVNSSASIFSLGGKKAFANANMWTKKRSLQESNCFSSWPPVSADKLLLI